MYKKYVSSVFIAVSSLFSLPIFASTYIPCDGCSYLQMRNAAIAHGVGRFVVGNIASKQVQGFQVRSGRVVEVIGKNRTANTVAGANIGTGLIADLDDLTASELAAFSAYVKFYNLSPIGYHKQFNLLIVPAGSPVGVPNNPSSITSNGIIADNQSLATDAIHAMKPMAVPVPGGGTVSYPVPGVNAYDMINGGPTQNTFLSWIGGLTTFNVSNAINTGLSTLAVFHITDVNNVPVVSITVTFTDNSHIGVYIDNNQQPPQIKVNPNTAVDSHGNTIPASAPAVAGSGKQEYNFLGAGNGGDAGNMASQIGSFGINPPASAHYACTRIASGTIHCVAY